MRIRYLPVKSFYTTMFAMNIYIAHQNNSLVSPSIYKAIEGFTYLGHNPITIPYKKLSDSRMKKLFKDSVVISSIEGMKSVFSNLGIELDYIDYPDTHSIDKGNNFRYYKRKITKTSLSEAISRIKDNNEIYYLKPVETKLFPAYLSSPLFMLKKLLKDFGDVDVWLSKYIPDTLIEYRVFVYKGKIIDIRHYHSSSLYSLSIPPRIDFIEKYLYHVIMPTDVYIVDIAQTESMSFVLEVNDSWAFDDYGLDSTLYANMLMRGYRNIIERHLTN